MPRTRMLVSQCDVGTILAEDVRNYPGITLVAKDSVLNQYILDRLGDYGITHVWIYTADALVSKEEIDTDNNSNSNKELIMTSHVEAVLVVKQVLRELSSGGKLNYPKITQLSKLVYGNINDSVNVIKYLKAGFRTFQPIVSTMERMASPLRLYGQDE